MYLYEFVKKLCYKVKMPKRDVKSPPLKWLRGFLWPLKQVFASQPETTEYPAVSGLLYAYHPESCDMFLKRNRACRSLRGNCVLQDPL